MLLEKAATKVPKCARQDDAVGPQEPDITGGLRAAQSDGKDDMVGGLEVCDELYESNANVDDGDEGFTDAMTGATLLRHDAIASHGWRRRWLRTTSSMLANNGRARRACQEQAASPSHVDGMTSTMVTLNVWKYGVD